MPGHEEDEFFKHHWVRSDDGKEVDYIVAKCGLCDIYAIVGGRIFTQKQWDVLAPEDKTELAVAKP